MRHETTKTALRQLVERQANDEGLWFVAQTAPEGHLQRELRRLHSAVEAVLAGETIERLRSGVQPIEAKWQPIETAPKDAPHPGILVAWDAEDDPSPNVERMWRRDVAYWFEGYEGDPETPPCGPSWQSATTGDFLRPTHWMPLPEPPKGA